jgi:uncharacterized phiE125 gp8 family phage protein
MGLKLLIPPFVEPITLEEAKKHCRIETDDENTLIEGFIKAAREHCEKFQNRAYCQQTFELWLDAFPTVGQIQIPRPPLISVESIKYYDVDNVEHEFSDEEYFVDTKNEPGWVVLNYGSCWPTETLRPANGVCVIFTAGYEPGDYDDAENVPADVKSAIKLLVGHLFENRESTSATDLKEIPKGVNDLLWPDRIL